ncbi:MAG: hypothetical protein OEO17_13750 [Gemmatimonadota bacterium]|nr:hypothetical protein [Gemmatimonadota bacterium]MDH3368901.1 hypothetical protein [Gemmatimonadota bacterium]MDH3569683.1 hypothetical protein [Gemmatimonadota bacterium]MDH5549757.1 hypothetical protein [Gemmatimonadota bacterium]
MAIRAATAFVADPSIPQVPSLSETAFRDWALGCTSNLTWSIGQTTPVEDSTRPVSPNQL